MMPRLSIVLLALAASPCESFLPTTPRPRMSRLAAAPADSDFQKAVPVQDLSDKSTAVDPNVYNVDLDTAASLWTASVSAEPSADRPAGIPYLDVTSKDYFVDDLDVVAKRSPSLGLDLLELAGGRDDGYGITMVTSVSGNAAKAGILPGDSIAAVSVTTVTNANGSSSSSIVEDSSLIQSKNCECKDFDGLMDVLGSLPSPDEAPEITLRIKRIRRWPKLNFAVSYPPSQCAEGVDNVKQLEFFAGENLRRALLNRGIVMDDPEAPKCDFCGGKCYVRVTKGMKLLSPLSTTEQKIMARNPGVRLSCKTVIGYNMQEGDVDLQVNLQQW